MIKLTDEENPYKIPKASIGQPIQMFSGDVMYAFNEGAKAQLKKVVEDIDKHSAVEQLPHRDGGALVRTFPEDYWQALLGEIK